MIFIQFVITRNVQDTLDWVTKYYLLDMRFGLYLIMSSLLRGVVSGLVCVSYFHKEHAKFTLAGP